MIWIIDVLLLTALVYLASGLVFSIYFYSKGAKLIDEGTKGTPWHFKLIIFPGVVLFWLPLLLKLIKRS